MRVFRRSVLACVFGVIAGGCLSYDSSNGYGSDYQQVNLLTDTTAFAAKVTDTNLANPWGIAVGPDQTYYVANNRSGVVTRYDIDGNAKGEPILIPGAADTAGEPVPAPPGNGASGTGSPTGIAFNASTEFMMPQGGGRAKVITAGEDGTLSAWNGGPSARIVVDNSKAGAVYKGLALAVDSGKSFLYAADFRRGRIDVFDGSFKPDSSRGFVDPEILPGFAPFNIALVGRELYVAYARRRGPDKAEDSSGVGAGFVSVFGTSGVFKRRFASSDHLNSPWAMVSIPGFFGPFEDGIFIGNFGDGTISVFDVQGRFLGEAQDNTGHPIIIEGLWGLYISGKAASYKGPTRLYFTAGPGDKSHGLFGYLSPD
jgi:uncharacterized protein (TIGR03118 family)